MSEGAGLCLSCFKTSDMEPVEVKRGNEPNLAALHHGAEG